MCGCDAHQSELSPCTCLCDEHDKHFDRGVIIVREALRHQASETYRLQQQMGNVTHRLRRVEETDSKRRDLAERLLRETALQEKAESPAQVPVKGNDTNYWPSSPRKWEQVPLNAALSPDATIRLTVVGPAGDGWDGTRSATEFMWDNEHSVTVEVLR